MIKRILIKLIPIKFRNYLKDYLIDLNLKKINLKLKTNEYFANWKIIYFEIDNQTYQMNCIKYDRRIIAIKNKIQNPKILFLINIAKHYKFETFIDIGANYGEFCVPISNYVNKTTAIEPNPLVYRCLNENMKNSKNFFLYNSLISDQDGFEDFKFSIISSGGGSLFKKKNDNYANHHSTVNDRTLLMTQKSISTTTLIEKEILNKESLIIKIDIEGSDLLVATKMLNILSNYPSKFIIMFEYNKLSKNKEGQQNLGKFLSIVKEKKLHCNFFSNTELRKKKINIFYLDDLNKEILPSGEMIVGNFLLDNKLYKDLDEI